MLTPLRRVWLAVAFAFALPATSTSQTSPQSKPTGDLGTSPKAPPFQSFPDYLRILDEPSLLASAKQPDAHCYRFIWIGLPGGRVIVVRLSIGSDGSAKLIAKVRSGVGVVLVNKTDKISEAEVQKFYQVIERSNFWRLRSTEPEEIRILDGTMWALEAIRDGAYHIVYRRNPAPSLYTEVGRYLAKNLAKLDDSMVRIPEYP